MDHTLQHEVTTDRDDTSSSTLSGCRSLCGCSRPIYRVHPAVWSERLHDVVIRLPQLEVAPLIHHKQTPAARCASRVIDAALALRSSGQRLLATTSRVFRHDLDL